MPELPAMENFRLLIEEGALKRVIDRIALGKGKVVKDALPAMEKALVGAKLTEARRYGKYVFVRTSAPAWLAFHCGLTGYFEVHDSGEGLEKAKLLIHFKDGGALAFFDPRMFGSVHIVESPEAVVADQKLGPDAGAIGKADFIAAMEKSGQPLKGFFLDQSILAGIGNVYADEILFRAKIDPRAKAKSLDKKTAGQLFAAMGTILKIATDKKASLDNWDMLPPSWLARHREVGVACPRCDHKIEDYTVAGRHGYYCPQCQGDG